MRSEFVLDVLDARRSTSALDALGANSQERDETAALLAEIHSRGWTPLEHLCAEVEGRLRIVGLDKATALRQALRFTVLQSTSCGRIGHAPAKIHQVTVGPPGHGKKLMTLVARALNPACQEASPSKISPAGLVGASSQTAGGWRSHPGLLANADGGVLVLQDAHAISRAKIQGIAPILQELIEDGVVRDSVAGGQRRETSVGLVIDLNRLSQVFAAGTGARNREAPILGIRPLLSRVDFIVEIHASAAGPTPGRTGIRYPRHPA